MEYFKKNFTVIWFDYRGHHLSEMPRKPEQLTIENIAKDAECLLDELKIDKITVLGHSMGVNIVLEIFHRVPERIKSLILANGSARGPLERLLRTNLLQMGFPYLFKAHEKFPNLTNLLWKTQVRSKFAPWIVGILGFNPSLAKVSDIKTYVEMVGNIDMIVTLQLLKDYESYDATAWIDKIDVPTLIIAGEKDLIIPREEQEIMHQLIQDSRYELIRNGSHCPQMDIPELINIMIDRFLKDVYSSELVSPPNVSHLRNSTRSEVRKSRHGDELKP